MPLLFIIVLEVLATAIRQEKETKGIQIGREKLKLSLFADDVNTLYRKPQSLQQKTIRTKLKSVKFKDTRLIYRNLLLFLYINNEVPEEKENMKKNKILGINLSEEVEDLYSENYKTLMKEIEDNTKKWKDIPCSEIGRILLKCL